eukprot:c15704_g1_i1.p1 GENE.c15704_g1_i1~~c15704_g1_i1.p1  ORF type:complete len:285 (+),score=68.04 c15704_g1_i1:242-1096(+)
MSVSLEKERVIVFNMLRRLYVEPYAKELLESLYSSSPNKNQPLFSGFKPTSEGNVCKSSLSTGVLFSEVMYPKWKIVVSNLSLSHCAYLAFPRFSINIIPQNQSSLTETFSSIPNISTNIPDLHVQLSVSNKWTDVSEDVLRNQNRIRLVKNGRLDVDDFVIHEVSIKHGGYFTLSIDTINVKDFEVTSVCETEEGGVRREQGEQGQQGEQGERKDKIVCCSSWSSDQIRIHCARTLAKRKRTKINSQSSHSNSARKLPDEGDTEKSKRMNLNKVMNISNLITN